MGEIKQPSELQAVSDFDFTASFINNLDVIFEWAPSDILNTLNERSFDLLFSLRSNMCDRLKETFHELSARVAKNRTAKHLVVKDIMMMGESLTKNEIANDIEKVIFKLSPSVDDVEHDNADLTLSAQDIPMVVSLLQGLQSSILTLTNENKILTEKIESLIAKKCECRCSVNTPKSVLPSQVMLLGVSGQPGPSSKDNSEPSTSQENVSSVTTPSGTSNLFPSSPPQPLVAAVQGAGNNSSDDISPAHTSVLKELYVGNVDIKNSCNDIAFHLGSKGIKIMPKDVRLLKQRKDASSFCVKIQEKDFNKASNTDNPIWPVGVKFRPFLEQAPRGLQSTQKKKFQSFTRPTRKSQQSNMQPFRHEKRHQYPRRNTSQNRYLPLQYYGYEPEYEDEWPELAHSYASRVNRGYY